MLSYNKYVNEKNIIDISLLEEDIISFSLLIKILEKGEGIFLTDHKNFIIASSEKKYPIWVWTKNRLDISILIDIYNILKEEFKPLKNYVINCKITESVLFKELLNKDFNDIYKKPFVMVSYECLNPIKPKQVEGNLKLLDEKKYIKTVANMLKSHYKETENIDISYEDCIEEATEKINQKIVYGWEDLNGNILSICVKREQGNFVRFINVYTYPSVRGNNIAANLIYLLCKDILNNRKVPILYADMSYVPSNKCYQKIGFKQKGLIASLEPIN